ncbi:MAG: hypothetical protein K8R36_11890 [Planctomycetales bacterium]|nr:hypothetical protein [Planctomycetales bacterium]
MGRSSALTPGPADVEDYSEGKATFSTPDGTRYWAEKVGDKIRHHELGTDAQGRTVYDLSVPISLAIGSGTRGKTYGINRDGIIFQSPITWYSEKGGYFQLSPGYENIAANPRFSRRMIEDCLVCHIGRMEFDPEVPDKLLPPYFHEIAIGCERCHGPGEKHVAAQQLQKSVSPDPTIVNPARLPPRERESICNQCHLHGDSRNLRFGRKPRDFRPGMALEEIFCVFVKDDSSVGGTKAVSQVEQMRESACYKSNPEKLGCTSCHDPHAWPEPRKRVEYYRSKCNDCHADRGCALPEDRRAEQKNSCIACHMPRATPKDVVHASQTDHLVLKNPQLQITSESTTPSTTSLDGLKIFDRGESRLPQWEVQRIRGIWLARNKQSGDPRKVLSLLLPLTEVVPDDVDLMLAIGSAQLDRKFYAESRLVLEKGVALAPKNEQLHLLLAIVCLEMKDFAAATEHIGWVVKLNPYIPRNFELQAKILAAAGNQEGALRAAERVVELDPTETKLRDQLLKARRN